MGLNPTENNIYKIQTNATFLWPQRNVAQRNSLADFRSLFVCNFSFAKISKLGQSPQTLKFFNANFENNKYSLQYARFTFYKLSVISLDHHVAPPSWICFTKNSRSFRKCFHSLCFLLLRVRSLCSTPPYANPLMMTTFFSTVIARKTCKYSQIKAD